MPTGPKPRTPPILVGYAAFVGRRLIRYLNTAHQQHRGGAAFRYSGDGITNL